MLVLGERERVVDLDVGIASRRHLAEHLHQAVLAEADRGVALLAGEQRSGRLQVQVVAGHPVEDGGLVGSRVRERSQPLGNGVPVGQRVVDERRRGPAAGVGGGACGVARAAGGVLAGPDERVLQPLLALGVVGQWHLVELLGGLAGAGFLVADRHQLDADARVVLAAGRRGVEPAEPAYVGDGELAALAAEPACPADELLERADGGAGEPVGQGVVGAAVSGIAHQDVPPAVSSTGRGRRNQ